MATFVDFVERQGWNCETQIELLLLYIARQQSPAAFRDYLQSQADEEADEASETSRHVDRA